MAPSRDNEFARLVRELSSPVGSYLGRRLYPLSHGDLDDLIEETFTIIWRRLEDVPVDAELPWAIGVARNVLRNAKRAHARRLNYEGRVRPRGSDPSAEENVIADEGVRDALRKLSEDDREILLLHAWDGLNADALAQTLLITPNAAAVRLSRAQAKFKENFNEVPIR